MKRCPKCRSRKWRENQFERGKWKCFKCGYEWWDRRYHKPISTKEQRYGGVNGNAIALIDYHNIVYKFNILKDNPNIHLPNQRRMRGWIQEWEENNGAKFQRTPKSIIIFLNKRFVRNIKKTSEIQNVGFDILNLIKDFAQQFQKRYNILLDLEKPEPVKKEVKLLEGFRSGVQFKGNIVKCVYPDGRIEFVDPEKALNHTQNFVENLALESKADQIMEAMVKWNRNFELHYSVLNEMKETLKLIQQNNHQSFFSRLFLSLVTFFGLRSSKVKYKTSTVLTTKK